MSDIETAAWSEAAASNNQVPPNGWPEGMNPSAVNDAAREGMAAVKRDWNRSHTTIASTGSANAYVLTFATAPSAYVNGQQFSFNANFANTGSATANVNSLGAKTIRKQTSSGMANVASGDIQSGQHVLLEYDSGLDQLILLNPQSGSGLATPVSVANGGTGATTLTGVLIGNGTSAVTAQAPLGVANGGIGAATLTAHGVLMGETTSAIVASSAGTAGQVFTSGGSSADGSYQNISGVVTKTADYTLVQADQGDTFVMNSASAHTITLPDDATVGNGWTVRILNRGTGLLTIARAGTDTISSGGSTSLTSLQLSQGDAGDITADGVSHGVFYWRGHRHYDSGQQTITSAGALTLAHGLGVQPQLLLQILHNTTSEGGYSSGNEVPVPVGSYTNTVPSAAGASFIADATNLTVRFANNANTYHLANGSTGNFFNITNANWKVIFRAWVFN